MNVLIVDNWHHVHLYCLMLSANIEEDVVEKLPADFDCGVYFGWASVDNGPVYKMVMNVGFNPFYSNTKKTMVCIVTAAFHPVLVVVFDFIWTRHHRTSLACGHKMLLIEGSGFMNY